ncbi:MAG: hypothetical protein RL354_2334 [Planctomycetota bacterium]
MRAVATTRAKTRAAAWCAAVATLAGGCSGGARSVRETAPQTMPETMPEPMPESMPESMRAEAWSAVSTRVRIDRARQAVAFDATAVISEGFLEQYVCTVGTREHESLFAFEGKSSEIHAALLLAGFQPGTPGRWREVPDANGAVTLERVPPAGDEISAQVRLPSGEAHPLDWFVRASPVAPHAADAAPPSRLVFGGSRFITSRKTQQEFYAADASGSLIGLVTFGDETIGAVEVIPDQVEASPAVWEVFVERMPPPGTKVTIVLAPGRAARVPKSSEIKR